MIVLLKNNSFLKIFRKFLDLQVNISVNLLKTFKRIFSKYRNLLESYLKR